MQQFWENPKIAHLIFVLEIRTFNFRFEKHLIFHLIFTELSRPRVAGPGLLEALPRLLRQGPLPRSVEGREGEGGRQVSTGANVLLIVSNFFIFN